MNRKKSGFRGKVKTISILITVLLLFSLFAGGGTAEGSITRLGGADRYETSSLIARDIYSYCGTVIIARGDQAGNFADGLAAGLLSGAFNAPVLLTEPGKLPASIKTEIARLGADRAVVLGGKQAVSDAVVASLRDLGLTVSRIGGADRYETAALIASEAKRVRGFLADYALIVNGAATADSLVAAPAAFRYGAPILMVTGDGIPQATQDIIDRLGVSRVYIVGGTAVVGSSVESRLGRLTSVIKRLGGADRYATSVALANELFAGEDSLVITGGLDENLVDSIGACIFGKPVLYVRRNSIPDVVNTYLNAHITAGSSIRIIGGTSAVAQTISALVSGIITANTVGSDSGGSGGEGDGGPASPATATVTTVLGLENAIANKNIKTITVGADITGDVEAARTGSKNLTINFGSHALTGNFSIIADQITALALSGSASPAITGNLTVTAGRATVTNGLEVGGTVNISDVGGSSWIERADGNSIVIEDPNGGRIVIYGNPEDITVEAGAGGINITANSPVTITVEPGAAVNSIEVAGTAAGTIVTNNGTVASITANGDMEIVNNSGGISVQGSGTVGCSGDAAAGVTGTATIVEGITLSIDPAELFPEDRAVISLLEGGPGTGEPTVTVADTDIVSSVGGLNIEAVAPGRTLVTVQYKNAEGAVTHQGLIFVTVRNYTIFNTTDPSNPTWYKTIQDAIDAAEEEGTITVEAGEYLEQLIIDKPLTLSGPNAGIAGTGARNGEAVIKCPAEMVDYEGSGEYWLINIMADDVTVSGFTIDDNDRSDSEINVWVTGINARPNRITIENNILRGFNNTQICVTSVVWSDGTETYHNYADGCLVKDNLCQGALDYSAIYIQGVSGSIVYNTVENAPRAITIQPYGNQTGGLVAGNTLSGFRTGIYYNGARRGAGAWTISTNTITAARVEGEVLENYGDLTSWAGFEIVDLGTSGAGDAPAVSFTGNTVNGAGANEGLPTIGILLTPGISDDADVTFDGNVFSGVSIGAERNAGALDLAAVLIGNTFPEDSAVVGNRIMKPTSISMSAENVETPANEEFTMSVNTKGEVASAERENRVRFYGVIPGLAADNIQLAEITGGAPALVSDPAERGYANAQSGDLVLAWGPAGGFPLGAVDYSGGGATTQFKAAISLAGEYTVTFVFYDITGGRRLNLAGERATITVRESGD